MGCPTKVRIGQDLVFSICTNDLDEGLPTNTDEPPKFRIYRDLEHEPIHTGEMHQLDKGNVKAFYATILYCRPEFGFQVDKNYTIHIEAAVNGDVSAITYNFIVDPGN